MMPKKIFKFFASYGLASVLLFFLLLLTFFGTLEQVEHGLFEVQKKYFESFFLVHYLFGVIPLPLPGVYLLLGLLSINIVCGAIIRAPKQLKRPGMQIAHFGIIYLVFAGFVTFHFSTSGHMTLYEGQRSNEFVSYYDWEIVIQEQLSQGPGKKYVIPHEDFADLPPSERRVFFQQDLPFDLAIEGFAKNTTPRPAPAAAHDGIGVEGVVLQQLPLEKEAERNVAGAYAIVMAKDGSTQKNILWGFAQAPWVVDVDGKQYAIDLHHTRTEVPFTIALNKFIRELHPRTGMASNFESKVTKIEGGLTQEADIKMNEPLRHLGYTFFQASWGPSDAGPNEPLFSVFSVVRNPADKWPLYACIVISVGLLIHFLQRLYKYLRAENRRHAS